jgi:hypothetical protein
MRDALDLDPQPCPVTLLSPTPWRCYHCGIRRSVSNVSASVLTKDSKFAIPNRVEEQEFFCIYGNSEKILGHGDI